MSYFQTFVRLRDFLCHFNGVQVLCEERRSKVQLTIFIATRPEPVFNCHCIQVVLIYKLIPPLAIKDQLQLMEIQKVSPFPPYCWFATKPESQLVKILALNVSFFFFIARLPRSKLFSHIGLSVFGNNSPRKPWADWLTNCESFG